MNVVIYSARNILALLLTDFAFGAVLHAMFILIGRLIPLFFSLFKRLDRFEDFVAYFDRIGSGKTIKLLGDIIFCLSAACGLMVSAFLKNSGNFRLLSVPFMIFGLTIGGAVCALLDRLILWIFFWVKRLTDILLSPVRFIVIRVIKAISRLFGNMSQRIRKKIIRKYTAYRFARIKDEAKFGFIDDYYKEVSK